MLYSRQILILFVSLYTVRIIIAELGVVDYGIYSVIAGVISFFSFLSGTMASATQRFFSFALGEGDNEKLKKTFTVNWVIYGTIAVSALILLETLGIWFVYEHLKIPDARFESAVLLYHFSVFSFVAMIFTTPFMAIIIAHEDMHIYAQVSILEAILKLGIVLLLQFIMWDKLELYGILMFMVSLITFLIYAIICTWKYAECQFRRFYWDKELMKQISWFTGWTLFGQITTVFRNQGVTILVNQVFNPVIVAARAISMSVATKINIFASNFNVGLYPSIIKSYAVKDKKSMFEFIFNGAKLTFFLNWVFTLPMIIAMKTILIFWLGDPPIEAILFTQLALIESMILSLSLPITTAARASGNMKMYELILGTIQLLIFAVSWVILKMGAEAYSVFIVAIVANVVMFYIRLILVKQMIQFSVLPFFNTVILPLSKVILFSACLSYLLFHILPKSLIGLFLFILNSVLITSLTMYFIGLNRDWQLKIKYLVRRKILKVFGRV